jgi:hypothetical protein
VPCEAAVTYPTPCTVPARLWAGVVHAAKPKLYRD